MCIKFDPSTSTFCQIWVSYWSRSTGRSKVLVEVKFGQKGRSKGRSKFGGSKYRKGGRYENGRITEKVELMRTQKTAILIFDFTVTKIYFKEVSNSSLGYTVFQYRQI